ncbi:MAG: LamG domain-containing protein [Bacteroidales bacterium]|nr:LamG domain-containing protein [Bacteroidales bacterium]
MKLKLHNPLLDNLSSYWAFQETDGSVYDSVGTNNGTINGDVSRGQIGKIGNSYYFDGSTGYVSIGAAPNCITGTGDFGVSCWAWVPHDVSAELPILSRGGISVILRIMPNTGYISSQIYDNTSVWSLSVFPDLRNNNWHHIVWTINRDAVNKIYIDGILKGSNTAVRCKNSIAAGNLIIGRRYAEDYLGKLDEIGIWSRFLTDSDVSLLYNNGNGLTYNFKQQDLKFTPAKANVLNFSNLLTDLECYYAMDGSLGYAKDYSPKHRDASIVGTIEQDASGIINTGFKWPDVANNSYLRTPAFSLGESQLSINFWSIPVNTGSGVFPIISDAYQVSTAGFLFIYAYPSGVLAFQYGTGVIYTSINISLYTGYFGQWVMTTITADYTHRVVSFYINGILVRAVKVTDNMLFPTLRTKYIGTYSPGYSQNFKSNMDEFGIWSRLLSPSEIKQLYNAGSGKAYPFAGVQNQDNQLKLVDPLLDRIQAYYPLNDSSNNIIDVTGNGRDGVNDGATPLQPGKIGTCYYFNDANVDNIYVVNGITAQTGLSFACWFNWGGDTTHINTFLSVHYQEQYKPFHWIYWNSNRVYYQSSNSTYKSITQNNNVVWSTSYILPTNTWTHLAVTHAFDNGNVTFYINGTILSLVNSIMKPYPCNNTSYNIGSYSNLHPFDGYLDEIGIWAKALTSDDVSRLYNNGNGLTYPFKT